MSNQLKFFSIFSGIYYSVPEEHAVHMDCGQIPVTDFPKDNCRKCHGRGYEGVDSKKGHYNMCLCLMKKVDPTRVVHREVFDIPLNTKYEPKQ